MAESRIWNTADRKPDEEMPVGMSDEDITGRPSEDDEEEFEDTEDLDEEDEDSEESDR